LYVDRVGPAQELEMPVLQRFHPHAQVLHAQRRDTAQIAGAEVVRVALHMDLALQVQDITNVFEDLGQAAV
jgi:hypothetical protein